MVFDAVVAKLNDDDGEDKIFLFFLDPKTDTIKDGLNLEDISKVYNDLTHDILIVVETILKDGTQEADIDIDDFVGGKYGKYDIFIHIKDIMAFKLENKDNSNKTVKDVILEGDFTDIAKNCIQQTKDELNKNIDDV